MFKIDRDLVKIKVYYLIIFSALGCLMPYIPLFLRARGFSQQLAGTTLGFTPFLAFIVQPVFGFIADKSNRHKLVLFVCCLTTAFTYNTLFFMPPSFSEFSAVETGLMINKSGSYFFDCSNFNNKKNSSCPLSFKAYIKQFLHIQNAVEMKIRINTASNNTSNKCTGTCDVDIKEMDTDCKKLELRKFDYLKDSLRQFEFTLNPDVESLIHQSEYVRNNKMCHIMNTDNFNIDTASESIFNKMFNCTDHLTLNCRFQCANINLCEISVPATPPLPLKTLLILFLFLGYISHAPVLNILDGIAFNSLGPDNRYKYGKQRLWGNISLAIVALITGYVMNNTKDEMSSDKFRVAFHGYGIFFILLGFVLFPMNMTQTKPTEQDLTGMYDLFKNAKVLTFLVVMLFLGYLNGTIEFFLFWFVEEELKNENKLILGLCVFLNCFSEIISFFFSSKLLKKLGHLYCIYISMVAFVVRFGVYSVLQNAWFILPVELLNGLTFSLLWSAASSYGSSVVSESLSGTIQGMIHGIFLGLGKGLGGIITGQLYTVIGIRWIFRAAAVMTCAVLGIFALCNSRLKKDSMAAPLQNVDAGIPILPVNEHSNEQFADENATSNNLAN